MAAKKYVAYYRVSTAKQGASGLGLEAQRSAVADYVVLNAGLLIAECTEIESGKRNERPKLQEALSLCRKHAATLIIGKLDRLSRSVAFIAGMLEGRIDFVACDMPEANKLTIHIMAAMAEHEREAISARTKAALAAARQRGIQLGTKDGKTLSAIGVAAIKQKARERNAIAKAWISQMHTVGALSYQTISDALNARGITAPRGGKWHPEAVRRVCLSS